MARVEIGRAAVHFRGLDGKPLSKVLRQLDALEIVDRPLRHIIVNDARIQRIDNAALSEWQGGVVDASGRTPDFARLERAGLDCVRPRPDDDDFEPQTELDAAIFGGVCFAGYGHIILESLARIWAADLDPSVPILFLQRKRVKATEDILIAAATLLGIDPARFMFLEGDAICRRLIVPEPGMRLEMSVNRQHFDFIARRLALRRNSAPKPVEPPIYLSRSGLTHHHRRPFGEAVLETALERQGQQIIHPERLSLPEQVLLFDRADAFAGFIGSQFHNLIFRVRPEPVKIVYFCGETPSLNFVLLDALFPGERHYVKATSFAPLFEFGNRAPFCVDFDAIRDCADLLEVDRRALEALAIDAASRSAFAENWFENYFYHKVLRNISVSAEMPESERHRIFCERMDSLLRRRFDGPHARIALDQFERVLEKSDLLASSVTRTYRDALAARG